MNQNKKEEILFFDKFLEKEKEYIALSSESFDRLQFELSKSLKNKSKKIKIVDLGCGTGSFTKKLQTFSDDICGCDISPKSIEIAKKLCPSVNFSVQDIENLSYENNLFDVVVFSGVLHHFNDLKSSLLEAKRILKPGGLLFSFDPNLYNLFFWLYRRKKSWFYSKEGVTKNEEPLTKNKILNYMTSCSFNSMEVYGISNMSYKYIKNKKLSLFLPLYNFIDCLLDIFPPIRNTIGSFLITKATK